MKHHLMMVLTFLLTGSLAGCGGGGGSLAGSMIPATGASTATQSVALRTSSTLAGASRNVSSLGSVTTTVAAIDAGNTAAVGNWRADTGFAGGWPSASTHTIDVSRVSNPAPQAVYQTQRAAQNLSYTIANLTPNSAYIVRLHFAETFFTAANARVFSGSVNGVQAFANLDVFAAAGGANIAIVKEVTVQADGTGRISIALAASVNNASIAGIEIVTATASPTPTSTPAPSDGMSMNVGGAGVGTWVADADYHGGVISTSTSAIDTSHVTNAPPQSVYQSQRYGTYVNYAIPNLTPGATYAVKLHFAETYLHAAGQRVFGAKINGVTALANFDIFAAAGGANIAIVRQFTVTADTAGQISLAFAASVNNVSIAGIEIARGSALPTPTPLPTVAPTPVPTATPAAAAWPAAGWVPYKGGPLTVPVGSNPSYSADSATVVTTLWSGNTSAAGQLQVYAGPPPPSNRDYSPDVLYFGTANDPVYTIVCTQYGGGCAASGARVHIPRGAYPAGGTDQHIDIRDTVSGKDVMLWLAPVPSGVGGTYAVGWGAMIDSNSNGLNAVGSTASGVSAIWSLRETDLVHNSINHAIVVSVNGESPNGYVFPAVGWDNGYFKTNYPKMGAHFWLDVPPSQLPASCPTYARSYLTALNKYGAFFVDNGGITSVLGIQAESDMSYTYNGGASVWGPLMRSLGLNATGMSQIEIDNCGINMQTHMHILTPPAA